MSDPEASKSPAPQATEIQTEKPQKKSFKERFSDFVAEYGAIGLITWFTIFGLTIVGFALAFQFGLDVGRDAVESAEDGGSAVEGGGVWLAAYLAAQAVKPLRIVATFGLTPVLARVWKRMRGTDESTDED